VALTVRRFDDVDAFLAAAGEFLARREAEHNLILGIASRVRDHPELLAENGPVASATSGRRMASR